MLADFVADVGVVGMEFGEFVGTGVDVGEKEFGFVDGADDVEDFEGPAAGFGFEFFEWAETAVGAANFGCGACGAVGDDRNAGVLRDFVEEDVAADPSGAASCWGERCAAFDGGESEREVRDENDRADGPGGQVVVQHIKIWSAVCEDGTLHL